MFTKQHHHHKRFIDAKCLLPNESIKLKIALALSISALLSACGSKGSSESSGSVSVTPFTTWSAVNSSAMTSMSGSAVTQIGSNGSTTPTFIGGATGTFYFDSYNNFSYISSSAGSGNSVTFSAAAGDTLVSGFAGTGSIASNKGLTQIGYYANPYYYGFSYQTYGAWGGYGGNSGTMNAVSLGAVTPVTGIPATGTATFTGGIAGYLADPQKNAYLVSGTMSASVDFAARTASFSTANTTIVGAVLGGGSPTSNASLNMTGTMTYGSSANQLSGTVNTANGMTGNIKGQFYGPAANEIGGTFGVSSATAGSMVGSFGGKR